VSAFLRIMDYAQEHLPQLVVGLSPLSVSGRHARAGATKQVAELMWRIDHLPRTGLEETGVWPPGAALHKSQFTIAANKMNERHTIELQARLEKMVADMAAGGPTPHPISGREYVVTTLSGTRADLAIVDDLDKLGAVKETPVGEIVDRLLEDIPLDNENWGAW
jgi:hypothetical protein